MVVIFYARLQNTGLVFKILFVTIANNKNHSRMQKTDNVMVYIFRAEEDTERQTKYRYRDIVPY